MTQQPTAEHDVHLPAPSVWPFILGAGVSLAGFGLLVSALFTVVGIALSAWALAGWIRDLQHE
jgi:hypothetical protein